MCMKVTPSRENIPMILKVIAAASAPLLIKVGSGRVRRGGSSPPTGTPVRVGGVSDDAELELVKGSVGRAILVEKICEIEDVLFIEDVVDTGEVGDAAEVVCVVIVVILVNIVVVGSVA